MTTLLESCRIAPPPGTVAEQLLPLTFLDILWVHFHPIRRLLFFDFPCSKPYFLEIVLPNLKHSLSLALKHFFPLAGNIVYPLSLEKKPVISFREGDSVPMAVFESGDDFDDLVGNHERDADKFYDYIPPLPHVTGGSDHKLLPALAIQVTLFPGHGVCIGFANHHAIGDASSVVGFIKSWASINKLGGDEQFLVGESLPVIDRSVINYPEADSVCWKQMKDMFPMSSPSFPIPTKRVRATYVFSQSELKKIKELVQARIPGLKHLSSFVVTAAYVWSCLAKSRMAGEEEKTAVDDDELEFFLFAVDLRPRLDPPIPGNYFGNCLGYGVAKIRHQELVGDRGFFTAVQAISGEMESKVNSGINFLELAEKAVPEIVSLPGKRVFSVSGSARVDIYGGADFGWGIPRKLEMLSIDGEKYSMSLCKSRESEGGLEVGLSLPKLIMDAFAALFSRGINGE